MTLERIVPDDLAADDPMLREHLERYEGAARLLLPEDVVVDAACGVGYGTHLLAGKCRRATGVDCSEEAVAYARRRYGGDHVEFVVADLESDPFPACDVLVSFETVEHMRDPEAFIRAAQATVRRAIILSAPLGPTRHFNPFHHHDFLREDIERLLLPWTPVYFCYQSGAALEVVGGCWVFRRQEAEMEPAERMAWQQRNLDDLQREYESQRRIVEGQLRELASQREVLDRQQREFEELKAWLAQVEEGKAWLEGQYHAWRTEAARLQAMVYEVSPPPPTNVADGPS